MEHSKTPARRLHRGAFTAQVLRDNKAGLSGNIGAREVVRSPSDGYTLLRQNSTMVTNLGAMGKLPYDPEKDLKPIMLLGVTPIALAAHPSAQIGNLKELIAAFKAKPDALSYGSCRIGTPQHFAMELVKQKTGIAAAHVSYKGCAPALTDVVGGQIPLFMVSANLVAPYAKSGWMRVLAVSTIQRYGLFIDTPTFEDQGLKPFDFSISYALMGQAKLPPRVVAKLAADVQKILADPAVQSSLSNTGVEPYKGSAQELSSLIRLDAVRYLQLAKSANIKAEQIRENARCLLSAAKFKNMSRGLGTRTQRSKSCLSFLSSRITWLEACR